MARKRMIDPNIWVSEDFSCLNNLEKLVFIGLFSFADDEGYGKANPILIRNSLFPYSDDVRTADIEKSLCSIAAHMSVVFYETDGKQYYYLTNWNKWQSIQKPKASSVPKPTDTIQYLYGSNTIQVLPKEKEKEKKAIEKKGGGIDVPSLDEVKAYCRDNNIDIDCDKFFNHYESVGWKVNGIPITNWKARVKNWYNDDKKRDEKKFIQKNSFTEYDQKIYTDQEIKEILKRKKNG